MLLTSSVFKSGGNIPQKYTCEGDDLSPPLQFADIPEKSVSLVLIMDDPDVPASVRVEQMWDHWVVYDIPVKTRELKEGATPPGVQGQNTSGGNVYMGPCPPDREHRYFFKLYALDKELKLGEGATKAEVEKAMKGHIVAQAELIGLYNLTKNR